MGRIDDTNAQILEIGRRIGRIEESMSRLFDYWDDTLGKLDDGYLGFERLCLLFMEYEELTRPQTWRMKLEDNLYSVNPLIRKFSKAVGDCSMIRGFGGCPPTMTTNG